MLDVAGKRKRHKNNISTLGGVPIFIAFATTALIFDPFEDVYTKAVVMGAFLLLFITGLYDDLKPLGASVKFIMQFVAAIMLVYLADVHHSSYFTHLAIHDELIKIISVVFIVFIINAYNLIDGINGLSAMLSMAALLGFGCWFFLAGLEKYAFICFATSGAIIAFLRFNLLKTKIFLGDNGSMLLGLLLAYLSTLFIQYNQNLPENTTFKMISPFGVAFAAMNVPIMDTLRLFAMRTFYLEKSPFKADRNHLHHLLLRLGLTHLQISVFLTFFTLTVLFFAFTTQSIGNTGITLAILLIYISFLLALDYIIYQQYRKKFSKKTVFNEALRIRQELKEPMFYEFFFAFTLLILAVSIPYHRISASIPTFVLFLTFTFLIVMNLIRRKNIFWQNFKKETLLFLKIPYTRIILLFLLFYTIHYFIFPTESSISLSVKLLLLIYWIPLYELRKIINIKPAFILRAYTYGCFGFAVFTFYHSVFSFHKLGWDTFFFNNLLDHVKAIAITHSLYFNLAILFTAFHFHKLKSSRWKALHLLLLLTFVLMVVLFGSIVGYLVLLIVGIAGISFLFKSYLKRSIAIIAASSILVLSFSFVPQLQEKLHQNAYQLDISNRNYEKLGLQRKLVWQESVDLIKENWMWGVGVGNAMNSLKEEYHKIGYQRGTQQKFNAHNQFLETFLQTGIIGFILLVLLIFYCFVKAFQHRNIEYGLFLFVILIYMQVESLFETQMGMVAFAFFNALFLSSFDKKAGINTEEEY